MKYYLIAALIATILSTSSCSLLGLHGERIPPRRSLASLQNPSEGGSEVLRDQDSFSGLQFVDCQITAFGPKSFRKNFTFHFDLDQLHDGSWAERVNVGNGLEVYVNLWSFREYTLGLRDVRVPASGESRLTETKGLWSPSAERTLADLTKIRFQAKLFHSAGAQSYEVRCPN